MDDGTDLVDDLTPGPPGPTGRRRGAGTLWAVLAIGVLVVAAVVISSGGDEGSVPGLPVALGAARTGGGESAAADAMVASVTYVAGDDLPALGGEATAYRLSLAVTDDQVRSLADALGLAGPVVHDGQRWTVDEGSGHLEVHEAGMATWWYSATGGGVASSGASSGSGGGTCSEPAGAAAVGCEVVTPPSTVTTSVPDCAVASDGGDGCVDVAPPAPPADLPSEDDARTIALDLLAATGVELDDAVVRVDGGVDAWFVAVEPRLAGVPSGLVHSVTVGSGSQVAMAGGSLAAPEPLGDYPLLDTRAAIARANATPVTELPVVATGGDGTATAEGGGLPPDTTVPACKVVPDGREICQVEGVPEPGVPAPPPDGGRVEVLLVDAEAAFVVLPAVDGSADGYLVPAYRFTDAHGSTVDLPAVSDSALTTPSTTDTSAVDPPVTDTVVEPPSCSRPLVGGDAGGTTVTVQPDPDCVTAETEALRRRSVPPPEPLPRVGTAASAPLRRVAPSP